MSASLVGSEMCIRDSSSAGRGSACAPQSVTPAGGGVHPGGAPRGGDSVAVSYTHLTLPTICSV
eukprot:8688637-Alexandrium_andersonii.AAC.1